APGAEDPDRRPAEPGDLQHGRHPRRHHPRRRRLLAAAEAHAAATGLTLLVLDTQTGSPAERLYRGAGWTAAGTVPEYAADPAGVLRPTTLYYKLLAA
ncbi:hypothetical protein ACFWC8_16685, partial [Streptomyces roseolus]